jgi:hypothetical protein
MRKTMKRTQKLFNMKGCSKSKRNLGGKKKGGCWDMKKRGGSRVCKKCGYICHGTCLKRKRTRKQRGGNCGGTCGLQPQLGGCTSCLGGGVQMGGGINNSGTPLLGTPWTPKINDWRSFKWQRLSGSISRFTKLDWRQKLGGRFFRATSAPRYDEIFGRFRKIYSR